jgi:hypothetical protein
LSSGIRNTPIGGGDQASVAAMVFPIFARLPMATSGFSGATYRNPRRAGRREFLAGGFSCTIEVPLAECG